MSVTSLNLWIEQYARPGTIWFVKRLSGNDTLATAAHQAGPYLPRQFVFEIFPDINQPATKNPDHTFNLYLDSHPDHRQARIIWYNNRLHGGTRNETRMTRLGGQASALLNPDSTGSIAAFVFMLDQQGRATDCHAWVCDNPLEEDLIEDRFGVVEPKAFTIWRPGLIPEQVQGLDVDGGCRLTREQLPPEWLERFPSGEEIVSKTRELRLDNDKNVDDRLIRRRECEYEIFKSVEEAVYLPRMNTGFKSIDDFVSLAQTILQSRKSRSGTSLELHARDIMIEEHLVQGTDFAHRPVIEVNKRPDFIFPSVAAYNDQSFPRARLRMLAVKTTCKDRWRQITTEANDIQVKHLLTLQEGVSQNQFQEMVDHRVQLVVPTKLHTSYPRDVRPHLMSFESFIAEVRVQNRGAA
jgi:hypothetical protein